MGKVDSNSKTPANTQAKPTAKSGDTTTPETTAAPADTTSPPEPAHHAKPVNWREDFKALDKDHDGKLSKSELKLGKKSLKGLKLQDDNHDGKVAFHDFADAKRKAQSFDTLDGNHDGVLDDNELSKLATYRKDAFGADREGGVTREEFQKDKRADNWDNHKAIIADDFKQLSDQDRQKLAKTYDANQDGKIDLDEYRQGRHNDWVKGRDARAEQLFQEAGGKQGQDLTGKAARRYASYDTDGDGKVSQDEFRQGHIKDIDQVRNERIQHGAIADATLTDRMGVDENGFRTDKASQDKPTQTNAKPQKAGGPLKGSPTKDGRSLERPTGLATTFWNGNYSYKGQHDTENMSQGAWGDANKPTDYICAVPDPLKGDSQWWHNQKILVTNPKNGKQVVVKVQDKGPGTAAAIDLSPVAKEALGSHFMDNIPVHVAFAPADAPVGPVN